MKFAATFFGCVLLLLCLTPCFCVAEETNTPSLGTGTNAAPAIVLRNLDGDYVFLSNICYPGPENKSKPKSTVVLNFMAIDCVPCKKELPVFLKTVSEYKDKGVRPFLVSTDDFSKQEDLKAMLKEFNVTCEVLLDPYKVACKKLNVTEIPLTIILSRSGGIVGFFCAGEQYEKQLKEGLDKALKTVD